MRRAALPRSLGCLTSGQINAFGDADGLGQDIDIGAVPDGLLAEVAAEGAAAWTGVVETKNVPRDVVETPALRQVATQVGSAANSNMGGAATTSQCEKPVCEVRSPAAFL